MSVMRIEQWLSSLGFKQYTQLFIDNGYDEQTDPSIVPRLSRVVSGNKNYQLRFKNQMTQPIL